MSLKWVGPYTFGELLKNCISDHDWPPESNGCYIVTAIGWETAPSADSQPLYIGGNTGRSKRFCTRIGDLVADLFGFYDGDTGHHSGGQKLYEWCFEKRFHPSELFLGWASTELVCGRCAEINAFKLILGTWDRKSQVGLLNSNRPARCTEHSNSM